MTYELSLKSVPLASNKLTAQSVELMTASVTIRTMTVSGRQMTQSLFKQLPEEDIFVHWRRATLRGTPWGWVNYLLKRPSQINLVWQKGDELRRCLVSRANKDALDRDYRATREKPIGETERHYPRTMADIPFPGWIPMAEHLGCEWWSWSTKPPAPLPLSADVDDAEKERLVNEYRQRVIAALDADYETAVAHRSAVDDLFRLPQLFIAA